MTVRNVLTVGGVAKEFIDSMFEELLSSYIVHEDGLKSQLSLYQKVFTA